MRRIGSISFRRCWLLTRALVAVHGVFLALTILGTAGGMFIISIIDLAEEATPTFHHTGFLIAVLCSGLLITRRVFADSHAAAHNPVWLMLPASSLEKFLSGLCLTTLGVAVGQLMTYYVAAGCAEALGGLFWQRQHLPFTPFARSTWQLIALYVVVQAPFLVGAISLRRFAISITTLFLLAYGALGMLVAAISFECFFAETFQGWNINLDIWFDVVVRQYAQVWHLDPERFLRSIAWWGQWLGALAFWGGWAPFWWLVGYYNLKETEV